MKKHLLLIGMALLFLPGFSQQAPAGDIWLHMLTTGTPAATRYLGDKLNDGSSWYIQFEIGQASWNLSDAGIGKSNSDPSGWDWRTASWFSNGSGSNKQVQSDFGNFQFTSTGNWYFAGRAKADAGDAWHYANNASWGNNPTFAPEYYFTVNALENPTGTNATATGSSQVNLSWTQWNSHYVMVVRKRSTESWTEPTQGTPYTAGNTIGSGVVVYVGPAATFENSGLSSSTTYDYKFYTENNGYYSAGTVSSATTSSAAGDYFRSKASGDWNAIASWESSANNSFWISATLSPGSGATSVTILNGHTMTITGNEVTSTLTINNGGVMKINPAKSLTVSGTLTNSAGNGGLIIESDATGTGALIHGTASVAGTVKRYFPGASQSWHLLSAPVASQAIDPEFTAATAADYDFFAWYEPASTWINFKNTTIAPTWNTANGSTDFTAGKGYLVEYLASNPTKQFTGSLNNGMVSLSMTTGGSGIYTSYNLAGNPYPSPIDWKATSGWNRSVVVTSGGGYDMSIWNDAAGQYGTYNSASLSDDGTSGASRYIAVGQGFMVKASAAGSLGMDNGIRVTNSATYLKSVAAVPNSLRLDLAGTANTYTDEIMVEFGHPDNTGGAMKMFSFYETAPSLYTVKDQGSYSTDFRSELTNLTIPLHFKAGVTGPYTLTAGQLESFLQGTILRLEDLQTGHIQDLMANPTYSFTASSGDDAGRFLLHFGTASGTGDNTPSTAIHIYADRHFIAVSGASAGGSVTVYNILGQAILQQELAASTVTRINLTAPDGYYIVRVTTAKGSCTEKVFIHQ